MSFNLYILLKSLAFIVARFSHPVETYFPGYDLKQIKNIISHQLRK